MGNRVSGEEPFISHLFKVNGRQYILVEKIFLFIVCEGVDIIPLIGNFIYPDVNALTIENLL